MLPSAARVPFARCEHHIEVNTILRNVTARSEALQSHSKGKWRCTQPMASRPALLGGELAPRSCRPGQGAPLATQLAAGTHRGGLAAP